MRIPCSLKRPVRDEFCCVFRHLTTTPEGSRRPARGDRLEVEASDGVGCINPGCIFPCSYGGAHYSYDWMPMNGATRSEDLRRWRGGLARSTLRELRIERTAGPEGLQRLERCGA